MTSHCGSTWPSSLAIMDYCTLEHRSLLEAQCLPAVMLIILYTNSRQALLVMRKGEHVPVVYPKP